MAEKMQRQTPNWDLVAELHDENVGNASALLGKVETCTDLTEVDNIKPILSMNVDCSEMNQSENQSGEERKNKIIRSVDICEKFQYSEQLDREGFCKYDFNSPASQNRTMAEYVENQDKSHNVACDMFPDHEGSYHRTCNISPVDERSSSHRKRSRSRSLSIDSRRRSWSRSKSYSRGRMSGLTAVCRSFAAAMCARGDECKYLHEGGDWMQPDSHHDSVLNDGRGSRLLLYETNLSLTDDTQDQNNFSLQKPSWCHEKQREDCWSINGQYPFYLSKERCFDFTKGRCFRGGACKYIHHAASFDGGWSHVRDESRDRLRDKRASFNRKLRDLPCKYFLRGHCIHGEGCRFYHQVEPHYIPVQSPLT